MTHGRISLGNVVRFALFLVIYEAILVGAYLFAFRSEALAAAEVGEARSFLLSLLGMPDVVAVAVLSAVVSAGAATGAFFDYPKPNVLDVLGPDAPSGTLRVLAAINVGFRALLWAVVGAGIGSVLYLRGTHPDALSAGSTGIDPYFDAVAAHPDAVVGVLVGGVLGGLFGAFTRPTPSTGSGSGGGGNGDGGGE